MEFVGRKKEIEQLLRCYESDQNELVAVYGRRRVGKTALVDHCFGDQYFFRHVGLPPKRKGEEEKRTPSPLKEQLRSFYLSLRLAGWNPKKAPSTWLEAFCELILFIQSSDESKRKVVFIDEIPWMDTQKSAFLESFSWFVNSILTIKKYNVMIVIAGSSTSWMLDNVVNDYGGLYGRTTMQMRLLPFNLCETEMAIKAMGLDLPRYQIALAYMTLGGIPYYLKQIKPGLSFYQSVDAMFFKTNAEFKEEFDTLFSSMFDQAKLCERIVRYLSHSRQGYRRSELLAALKRSDGQVFSNALQALEKGSFVIKYTPYGGKGNEPIYKLIDPFCLFYLANVENQVSLGEGIWSDAMSGPKANPWKGLAFENLAFAHLNQIKYALGINGVQSLQFSWNSEGGSSNPTQIDLVIERKDKIINLCEMKFLSEKFSVSESYHKTLMNRENKLSAIAPKDFFIRHVLITTYGASGSYRYDFSNVILLDDLFLP